MFFRYGPFQHPNDEVLLQSFEMIPVRSERGGRREHIARMRVNGDIIADGQAAISNRIAELVAAYSVDYRDAALYQDDGTITRHALLNNVVQNVSGVQITHRSWPRGDPAEYATYRHFDIGFAAKYTDLNSELMSYRESVRKTGTGGPINRLVNVVNGPPRWVNLSEQSCVMIVQSGIAVGYSTYPTLFVPGPIYPALEIADLREFELISPDFAGRGWTDYAIQWRYVMHSPTNVNPLPNIV